MLVVITEPHHVTTTHSPGVSFLIVILITQYVIVKTQYVKTTHCANMTLDLDLDLDPGVSLVIVILITQYVIVKTQYVMTPHSANLTLDLDLDPGVSFLIVILI